MMALLLTAALRTLVAGTLAEGAFRLLRVHHPVFRKAVWACILLAGFAMPWLQRHPLPLNIHLPRLQQTHSTASTSSLSDPFVNSGAHSFSGTSADLTASLAVSKSPRRLPLKRVVQGVYLSLTGILLLRMLFGLVAAWRVVARSMPFTDMQPHVRLSSDVETPWTFGSKVILPSAAAEWDAQQLKLVLVHEACHVRHRDFYLQLAARIYAAIFWFSPLGWWLLKEMERLGEQTSDRAALACNDDHSLYANLLLRFSTGSTLPAVCMARRSGIQERVEKVMQRDSLACLYVRPRRAALLAFATVILAVVVGDLGVSAQSANQSQAAVIPDKAMATDASPDFLVATIKPTDPNTTRQGWSFESEGRHITCFNATLHDIVTMAYGLHAKQVVGAPDWFDKDHFDISGVPDQPGVPNLQQVQHMYQELLADRFHLVMHRDKREMPIYAITIAKGGPKLKVADPIEQPNTASRGGNGFRELKFENISMPGFATNLNFYEDRPVVDETGLTGRYDFTLKFSFDLSPDPRPDMPPPLATALREQDGLRIDAVKHPAEVLVIDRIQRPSQN